MLAILQDVLHWLGQRLLLFVVIVAVLVVGPLVRKEFRELELLTTDRAILRDGQRELETHRQVVEQAASERINSIEKTSQDNLAAWIKAKEDEIREKRTAQQKQGGLLSVFGDQPVGKGFVESLKRELEIRVLEQELGYLKGLAAHWEAVRNREAAVAEVERLRDVHVSAYVKLKKVEEELSRLKQDSSMAESGCPGHRSMSAAKSLNKDYDEQFKRNLSAYEGYERQRRIMERTTVPKVPPFSIHKDSIDQLLTPLNERIKTLDALYQANWIRRILDPVKGELIAALLIVILITLMPTAIKAFLYFFVAPWAAGRPPIRLLPLAAENASSSSAEVTAGDGGAKASAVSLPIVLAETEELLIRPEYLQSTSLQARKSTKWFLNPSIPFASLASGMFLLTRVSPAGSEPVVISATRNPLMEVGIIDLPEGAAFACQARSLAGVIQRQGTPMRITRHWRLSSLQSWLTLQLRFLVFQGPGQLVLKGCRGIRVESAGRGRLINQAATLGFSANLDYANTRCETFMSYWAGKEDLFNDLFTGEAGVYVFEETPNAMRRAGIGGSLQGFTDAILKMFGV